MNVVQMIETTRLFQILYLGKAYFEPEQYPSDQPR